MNEGGFIMGDTEIPSETTGTIKRIFSYHGGQNLQSSNLDPNQPEFGEAGTSRGWYTGLPTSNYTWEGVGGRDTATDGADNDVASYWPCS